MTPAEQLYAVPEPIQHQLVRIARLAAGMSATEKAEARTVIGRLSLHYATSPTVTNDQVPAAEMVSALGRLIVEADRLATTGKGASL